MGVQLKKKRAAPLCRYAITHIDAGLPYFCFWCVREMLFKIISWISHNIHVARSWLRAGMSGSKQYLGPNPADHPHELQESPSYVQYEHFPRFYNPVPELKEGGNVAHTKGCVHGVAQHIGKRNRKRDIWVTIKSGSRTHI